MPKHAKILTACIVRVSENYKITKLHIQQLYSTNSLKNRSGQKITKYTLNAAIKDLDAPKKMSPGRDCTRQSSYVTSYH